MLTRDSEGSETREEGQLVTGVGEVSSVADRPDVDIFSILLSNKSLLTVFTS